MRTILFCGGGTAGHIMPNIALIEKLRGKKLYYIGTGGMEKELLDSYAVDYLHYDAYKFRRSLSVDNLKLPFRVVKSIAQCKKILSSLSPDLVVSKGGFASFPVVVAASQLGIRCVSHESDSSLGLANKLTLGCVEKLFTPFPSTAKQAGKKGVLCSLPLRESVVADRKSDRLAPSDSRRQVLLVLGGSLGALSLNNVLKAALPVLCSSYDVILVAGKNKLLNVSSPHFREMEFCKNMGELYATADLALSRAGSNTLWELAANGIPSLLVPLKDGSRGEQIANASFFTQHNAAMTLMPDSLSPSTLISSLRTLADRADTLKSNLQKLYTPDTVMLDYVKNI